MLFSSDSGQLPLYARSTPQVLSVGELAAGLRAHVESGFADFWVEGEISNYRAPASGHVYFTLKDADAQIRCVMWRSSTRSVFFTPRDGMRVRARGSASVYEARGDLQVVVRSMKPAGEGALQQAFESLKRRLAEEGLFDRAIKKPLPSLPEHIGIVTSGDGAALQDILSILRRRYPIASVSVYPVRVQGHGAADEIAAALDALNAAGEAARPEVIIVGRGGGSLEDLWAFNEEAVARAITRSKIPTISAVGHETDFSIADFVADLRAATPSMAAELVAPDRTELAQRILELRQRMRKHVNMDIERRRRRTTQLIRSHAFNRPMDRLRQYQQRIDDLLARAQRASLRQVARQRDLRESLLQRLQLLDPMRPLERGYAVVERAGDRIRRSEDLEADDEVTLHFKDGRRIAQIKDIFDNQRGSDGKDRRGA